MKDSNMTRAYANALLQLAKEQNIEVVQEFTHFTELINGSSDFENLLFLDVFTIEERLDILNVVFEKESFSGLLKSFVLFLVQENRLSFLPMIFKELIVIDDFEKGFIRGTIEGSDSEVDPAAIEKIIAFLKSKLGITPELKYNQNKNISAGYKVTVQDFQIDATLDGQLSELNKNIINK